MGVIAIDQKGKGKSLAQMRMYVYPDVDSKTIYLLVIGDKKSQQSDIRYCNGFVQEIRKLTLVPNNDPDNQESQADASRPANDDAGEEIQERA